VTKILFDSLCVRDIVFWFYFENFFLGFVPSTWTIICRVVTSKIGTFLSVTAHEAHLCSSPHFEHLSFAARCNVAKTAALKASRWFWNVLLRFKMQISYLDFRGSSDLTKWRRTVDESRKTFSSRFIFKSFDISNLCLQRFKDIFLILRSNGTTYKKPFAPAGWRSGAITGTDCLPSDRLVQLTKVFICCELSQVTTKLALANGTQDWQSPTHFKQLSIKIGLNDLSVRSVRLWSIIGSSSTVLFDLIQLSPALLPWDVVLVLRFLGSCGGHSLQ